MPRPKKADKTRPSQKTRLLRVAGRLYDMLAAIPPENEDEINQWAHDLDEWLNELASQDAFGTEGQNDPRGDMRNGEWSMDRVEGLDK